MCFTNTTPTHTFQAIQKSSTIWLYEGKDKLIIDDNHFKIGTKGPMMDIKFKMRKKIWNGKCE